MRNRILLSAVLGALALFGTAGTALAQHREHGGHDGRGGNSAQGAYHGSYSHGQGGWYGGYGGWYGGPRFSIGIYGGYPYGSYYYSPYRYGYYTPYYYDPGYTYWSEPAYSDAYVEPALVMAEARLRVALPTPDAQLWIENVPMRQQGMNRTFATPSLESGKVFTYHIRARWMEGNREVDREKAVTVRAGEEAMVNFRDVATNVP